MKMNTEQLLPYFLSVLMLTCILQGCSEPQRKFSESDFNNATLFFCQKPNFTSSPLQGNSYVLYYDQETQLGNIGQFVYMGDYEWAEEVEEANFYNTYKAILSDNSVMLYLDHKSEDKTLHIVIDRKTLDVKFDYKPMKCNEVDAEELKSIKAQLVSEHVRYTDNNDRENRL